MINAMEYTRHPIADGRDAWRCHNCGAVYHEDKFVVDHPEKKDEVLCLRCARDWLNDNPPTENK